MYLADPVCLPRTPQGARFVRLRGFDKSEMYDSLAPAPESVNNKLSTCVCLTAGGVD